MLTLPKELFCGYQGDVYVQQRNEEQEWPVLVSERRKTAFKHNGICVSEM